MENFNAKNMNKITGIIVAIAVVTIGLISCQTNTNIDEVLSKEIVITTNADTDLTRTYIADEENGIIRWSIEDKLKVIENSASYYTTSKTIIANNKAQFSVLLKENLDNTLFTYNAFYPSSAVVEDSEINTQKVKIIVKNEQNPTATSYDSQADILISKHIETTTQPLQLNMQFKRLVAIAKMTLKNIPENSKISQVVFTAGEEDVIAGRNYVNAITGEVVRYGYNNSTNSLTLNYQEPITTRDIYFTCNPFDITAGESFMVKVVCNDAIYTKEVIIPEGRSLILTEGNLCRFTVNMNGASKENNGDINDTADFTLPICEWNLSKETVKLEMSKHDLIYSDDTTLIYGGLGVEELISYSFVNDKLDASLAYIPSDKIEPSTLLEHFSSYEEDIEHGGYLNISSSTYAIVSVNANYYCVGLALYNTDDSTQTSSMDNIIKYTSTTGEIVTPYDNSVFGANIISNVYEDGVGTITFDGKVTIIGESAFKLCSNLASITIPESVTKIGNRAFYSCSNLTTISIPKNVVAIDDHAFHECIELSSPIIIPEGVSEIAPRIFYGCSKLTTVSIPSSVTKIGDSAFYKCEKLDLVTIPEGVTQIGMHAFMFCKSLTTITIPSRVSIIGENAFSVCYSLSSAYIKCSYPPQIERLMPWEPDIFGDDSDIEKSNLRIYVPRASVNKYKEASSWRNYSNIIEPYDFE